MIFVRNGIQNLSIMATRNNSSSSTLLLVLVLIITFPFWIAAAGIVFGVLAGVFGAMIGVIGAIFGVLIGLIVLPFKLIFGWGHHDHDWGFDFWPHTHHNGFAWIAIIIVIALILKKKGKI
jgi:hypothetical protein